MDAFHTLRLRQKGSVYCLEDFELLFMLISALKWREKNGKIYLVTDKAGAEYIYRHGFAPAYNNIDLSLDVLNGSLWNEKVFWAGVKLYALSKQTFPCVMLDLDFTVWEKLDFSKYGSDVACIHREPVNTDIYPSLEYFEFKDGWKLPTWLDWSVEACNTALAYFGSKELVDRYTRFAFEYMKAADVCRPDLPYMVFVEQRWLAMCAKRMGYNVHAMATFDYLFGKKQQKYTHLWGQKDKFRSNPAKAYEFCRKCARRIDKDFPQWGEMLRGLSWATAYFE